METEQTIKCSKCGAINRSTLYFCDKCRTNLRLRSEKIVKKFEYRVIPSRHESQLSFFVFFMLLSLGLLIYWTSSAGGGIFFLILSFFAFLTSIGIRNSETKEAKNITKSTQGLINRTLKEEKSLPNKIIQIKELLQKAEYEYHSNAFGLFWDYIEQAAINLENFNWALKRLATANEQYHNKLKDREHNFPPQILNRNNGFSVSEIFEDIQRLTRMGLTNPDFAQILELRKTRKVLNSELKNIGEAINGLTSGIQHSIFNLQESISDSISELAEKQVETQKHISQEAYKTRRTIKYTKNTAD